MAVVLITRVPELSLDSYDRMMAELELDVDPPAGAVIHIASEAAGGINICEIWQTPQAAESFVERTLRDALRAQGVQENLSYRIEPLHNLFAADMDMIGRIGATSLSGGFARTARAS
jgi:hypothetical protein